MPDLSEMLGAVYGGTDEPDALTPDAPAPQRGPEWSDDEHLDRAFAEWTPGPGADAPAAERTMFAPAPEAAPPRLADDLAAALSEAVMAEAEPAPADDAWLRAPVQQDEPAEEAVVAETVVAEAPAPVRETSFTDLEVEDEPAPIPTPVHKAGWQRSDDDIIPTGRSGRSSGFRAPRPSLSRKPKAAKGPKAEKPAKAPKSGKGPKPEKAPKAAKAEKADKPKGKGLKREINFSFGKKNK